MEFVCPVETKDCVKVSRRSGHDDNNYGVEEEDVDHDHGKQHHDHHRQQPVVDESQKSHFEKRKRNLKAISPISRGE